MNKYIVGFFILGAAAFNADAQSSLTLYGSMDAGFNYISNSHGVKSKFNFAQGVIYTDKWGLRGVEDLGGGLTTVFQLENGFNGATGALNNSGKIFDRQAYIGLAKTGLGTVTMGLQYEAITDLLSPYGPTSIGSGGMGAHIGDIDNFDVDYRLRNSIKFKSATFHGFTGEIVYGFGNAPGSMKAGSALSIGANYVSGPFVVGGAYFSINNSSPGATDWTSTSSNLVSSAQLTQGLLSAKNVQMIDALVAYNPGALSLGLAYGYVQYTPYSGVSSAFTHSVGFNSVSTGVRYYLSPAWVVAASYVYTLGQSQDAGSHSSAPHYQTISIAAKYFLSKRTAFYWGAGYGYASGEVLNASGQIVPTGGAIGDSTLGAWSSNRNQTMVRVGMYTLF